MEFTSIDVKKERDTVLRFRREVFQESFGSSDSMNEEDYLDWLQKKAEEFPDGMKLVKKKGETVGQLELSVREFKGRIIGYVHLFYLEKEWRDLGFGLNLYNYAMKFFRDKDITEFHLRVAPENRRAVAFYKKLGMKEAGEELNGKVIRMTGSVNTWNL
ncbi:GNAT family N-acetyltransferase [Salimicrobium humidisoli]|uniref:GNAT family N-acetyltransferase n=1 Tax=Salimicrobium humidisoli TaxID=2029857 RepID=A0ABX4HTS5_9BACI|nr:GNAT family N-acetyltransferase [Salimicrobium humidisoli]PBB06637.1 GNAT family N-acetyltransferase [Salimicrobium humidisoli]